MLERVLQNFTERFLHSSLKFTIDSGEVPAFPGLIPPSTVLLSVPIVVNEMVLAVWLIVEGFNSSTIASPSAKTDMNEEK